MIDAAINHIATNVNQQLMRSFGLNEDVVVVANLLEQDGSVAAHVNNKIVLSLINIEKETAALVQQRASGSSAMRSIVSNPPLHFNLYLMFASYFGGNNYQEGLKFISQTISFFQGQSVFDQQNSPDLDRNINKLVMDIHNLNITDLSNLWGVLSGRYLPSVLYKLRMVTVDANAVRDMTTAISKPDASLDH